MSNNVHILDVEDVLSSIRRLVSEDAQVQRRPAAPPAAGEGEAQAAPADRLVLTEALRVQPAAAATQDEGARRETSDEDEGPEAAWSGAGEAPHEDAEAAQDAAWPGGDEPAAEVQEEGAALAAADAEDEAGDGSAAAAAQDDDEAALRAALEMPLDDDEAGDAERGLPDEGAGQAPSGDGEPDWPGDEAGPADGDADADRAASDDAAVLHSGDDDGAAEADAAADADTDPAAAGERAGLPGFLTVGRDGADWAGDAGPEHQDFAEPEDAADPWQDGEAALAPSEPDPAAADGGDGAAETDATLDWSEYDDSAIRAAAFEDDDDAVAVAPETLRDLGAAAGTVAEPAAGDDGQPAAAGNDGQPAVAGDDGQPAVAGDDGQPAAAGDDGQPAVAGDGGQPAAGENAPEQPAVAGDPADHGAASGAAAAASASRRLHLSADPGTGGEAAGRPAAAAAGTPDEDKMASPRAAGTDDAILLDEPGEEAILDEDTLRDLVSQVVREELMGELGERITRNVKKLVRREIQRALAGREFD